MDDALAGGGVMDGEQSIGDRPTLDHADADIVVAAHFDLVCDPVLGHELSHQNGARGCGRGGSDPHSCIVPPQCGQTSSAWPVSLWVRTR